MRLGPFGIVILCATGVASCRDEAQEREALVQANTESCIAAFEARTGRQPMAMPPGIDGRRLCACAVERAFAGKDTAAIREITSGNEPAREQLEAMGVCAIEEARGTGFLQ